jgi:hypothetical protein
MPEDQGEYVALILSRRARWPGLMWDSDNTPPDNTPPDRLRIEGTREGLSGERKISG